MLPSRQHRGSELFCLVELTFLTILLFLYALLYFLFARVFFLFLFWRVGHWLSTSVIVGQGRLIHCWLSLTMRINFQNNAHTLQYMSKKTHFCWRVCIDTSLRFKNVCEV